MNEENVSFDITDDLPAQELNLSFGQTHNFPHNFCEAEVNIKKFTNVQKLIVHLVSQEQIQLKYFAVKGIRQKHKRGIVHAKYEIAGLAEDHKKENELINKNVNRNII